MEKRAVMAMPKRRWRHEALALAPVAAAVAAMYCTFPRGAVGWSAERRAARDDASCAFVALSPAAETKAIDIVRSALSVDARGVREMRADLSISTVADEAPQPVMDASDRRRPSAPVRVPYVALPLPPSLAAPPPDVEPAPDAPEPPPAFSRDEMLKID